MPTPILAATRRDKKVVAGTLHFVLPTRIGETTIATDVDEAQVAARACAAIGHRLGRSFGASLKSRIRASSSRGGICSADAARA